MTSFLVILINPPFIFEPLFIVTLIHSFLSEAFMSSSVFWRFRLGRRTNVKKLNIGASGDVCVRRRGVTRIQQPEHSSQYQNQNLYAQYYYKRNRTGEV